MCAIPRTRRIQAAAPERVAALEPLEARNLFSADALAITAPVKVAAVVETVGDAYESNDAPAAAFVLPRVTGALSDVAGLATATDNDWYLLKAEAGRFEAQLRAVAADGELNLEVYTRDGVLLAGNYRSEDNSSVTLDLAQNTELLLFVYGKDGYQGNAYNLTWSGLGSPTPTTPIETPQAVVTVPAAVSTDPVPGTPDAYEENDGRASAALLAGAADSVIATATDNDWYRIDAAPGPLTVTLTSVVAEGELNLEIYDADGNNLGGRYQAEAVSQLTVAIENDGPVFVFVYGRGDYQGNTYELAWNSATVSPNQPTLPPVTPPQTPASVAGTPDLYEENDSRTSAALLAGVTGSATATATDNDWYRLDAVVGTLTVSLTSVVAEGELNLEVYDADGNNLGGRYQVEAVSQLAVAIENDGPVFVFVYGRGDYQGNTYELAWSGAETTSIQPVTPAQPPASVVSSPAAGTPDVYEENDSRTSAALLAGATGSATATATDNDWYRLDAVVGTLTVSLTSVVAEGELNLEVYDADGNNLGGRYQVEAVSQLTVAIENDGPVFVFIYGRGDYQGNTYQLAWSGDAAREETPVDPPTDPGLAPPLTPDAADFTALQPVLNSGLNAWAQAARESRADVLVLGDSVVFHQGTGWDGGLNAGFDRTFGLAGTGLLSGNYSGNTAAGYGYEAFGQNASNWLFDFIPGTDVSSITNDEIFSDQFARVQHPWGQVTVNPLRGSVAELGVNLNGNGDTAESDSAFTFQTWVSGDGATFNVTRTAEDGSVDVVGLQQVDGDGTQLFTFDFPAGESPADAAASIAITDPSQLTFVPVDSGRSLNEPALTVSNFRLLETGSTGATVTSWGYGGESTREFFAEQYEPVGQDNRAEILDRIVDGGSGKLLVFIMEGLNDRSEDLPSLNGIADGDSPEAFIDNVSTLIDGVRGDWAAAGNDASDLHFVTFGTYDQGINHELEEYSAALQQQATETEDVSFIDLRTLSGGLSLADMVELGYIQGASNGDFIHLTESGSVFYGEAIASFIDESTSPLPASTPPSEASESSDSAAYNLIWNTAT